MGPAGPQGDTGPSGDQGEKGDQGKSGDKGKVMSFLIQDLVTKNMLL